MRRDRIKPAGAVGLAPDMLVSIHGRLGLLDRLAFAAVFRASRQAFKPETPCLVLPGDTPETAKLFSVADSSTIVVRSTGHDQVVLGSSSSGWLVTADAHARMHLVNPITGEQHALPDITTIPCLYMNSGGANFTLSLKHFAVGPPPYYYGTPHGGLTLRAERMRQVLFHKVVLSNSPRRPVAMLITGPRFGAVAFAIDDGVWRLAVHSEEDGVEDAIWYKDQFYSITYSGNVEVWKHAGIVTKGVVVTPRLLADGERKYLVAAPDGRLMAVLKDFQQTTYAFCKPRWTCSFKVHVLDGEEWKETANIGDAALFVGANNSVCVSTTEHPELRPNCVYYTEDYYTEDDDRKYGHQDNNDWRGVGVYSLLEDGIVGKVDGLWLHRSCPLPAWYTPSIP